MKNLTKIIVIIVASVLFLGVGVYITINALNRDDVNYTSSGIKDDKYYDVKYQYNCLMVGDSVEPSEFRLNKGVTLESIGNISVDKNGRVIATGTGVASVVLKYKGEQVGVFSFYVKDKIVTSKYTELIMRKNTAYTIKDIFLSGYSNVVSIGDENKFDVSKINIEFNNENLDVSINGNSLEINPKQIGEFTFNVKGYGQEVEFKVFVIDDNDYTRMPDFSKNKMIEWYNEEKTKDSLNPFLDCLKVGVDYTITFSSTIQSSKLDFVGYDCEIGGDKYFAIYNPEIEEVVYLKMQLDTLYPNDLTVEDKTIWNSKLMYEDYAEIMGLNTPENKRWYVIVDEYFTYDDLTK